MISRDKVEGFLIGLGAGVLLAGFWRFGEEPRDRTGDRIQDAEALAASPKRIPTDATANAARAW